MTSQPGKLWLADDALYLAFKSVYVKNGGSRRYLKYENFCGCLVGAEKFSHQEAIDRICIKFGLRLPFTCGKSGRSFAVIWEFIVERAKADVQPLAIDFSFTVCTRMRRKTFCPYLRCALNCPYPAKED
jgi:hypothetical protein